MEYRKLISFGKSSYVVSLPKAWVSSHKLKKGDLIYFEDLPDGLLLNHREITSDDDNQEVTIDVNGKSIRHIQREIVSAYIRNIRTITLTGEEVKDKAKEIQGVIQNLVALEVMEQTSKRIMAKDFLNMKETDPQALIRKMDIIVRAMIEDCKAMFTSDVYENIYHRDNDVNKLSFLLYRTIRHGLEHSGLLFKKNNLSPNDLLRYWWVTYNLEAIGDDAKRVARNLQRMKLNKPAQAHFMQIFTNLEQNYLDMMRSFYKEDPTLAHAIHEKKNPIVKDCDDFYQQYHSVIWSGYLVNQLKSLANHVHNIGRSIYQY